MLGYLISFFLYIFAMHVAAEYSDAEDASYPKCCILGLVIIVVQFIIDFLLPYNFLLSGIVITIIGAAICIKVLKIPGSNFLMFIVMFAFFKLLINGIATLVINGISGS